MFRKILFCANLLVEVALKYKKQRKIYLQEESFMLEFDAA